MSGTLLDRVWFTCLHQFSWPRRSDEGNYYQVCLQCGVEYAYDWSTMRRTSRLKVEEALDPSPTKRNGGKCGGKSNWHPRERRLRHQVPLLYRCAKAHDWLEGFTENISRSGLLFVAEKELEPATELELILEMPGEICGFPPRRVLCQGMVARIVPATNREQRLMIAAAISGYEFISNKASVT
jgi:hypothetical protein